MNDQFSDFESQLRQLTPAVCDHLAEDTFYQAGWNAAVASLQQQNVVVGRRIPHGLSVASGMLCGLLGFAVAMTAWRSSGDAESVTQSASVKSMAVQPATLPDDEASDFRSEELKNSDRLLAETSSTGELFSIVSSILPWHLPPVEREHGGTRSANRALSVAAQSQWSSMIAAESTTGMMQTEARDTAESRVRDQLRAFPLSEWAIRDLL